jgi:hypothetical protein
VCLEPYLVPLQRSIETQTLDEWSRGPTTGLHVYIYLLSPKESQGRGMESNKKNIQQRVFASGHPPDY